MREVEVVPLERLELTRSNTEVHGNGNEASPREGHGGTRGERCELTSKLFERSTVFPDLGGLCAELARNITKWADPVDPSNDSTAGA